MSSNRDDFTSRTVLVLAQRVSYLCSHPECRKLTIGPHSDPTKSINLGEAAHISAAAPGGKRYDPAMTPFQRRSPNNGIWLCSTHATLIDRDENQFSTSLLHEWKADAENHARVGAFSNTAPRHNEVIYELSDADREFIRSLALSPEEATEVILPRLVEACKSDIQTFIDSKTWPVHTIPLRLVLQANGEDVHTDIAGIARGTAVSDVLNIVSAPGTGKTTTLIQLAETLLANEDKIPVFIPLGEWEIGGDDWFAMLPRRNAFRTFKPAHWMQLAYEGRLVFILDGWNEFSPENTQRAIKHLQAIQREYPLMCVVIGTRQRPHLPEGRAVRIEPLNEEQQLELARGLGTPNAEALLDQAWRVSGLRELVTIPLYLTALLSDTTGGSLPETKDEVLRNFVRQHEAAPDKATLLRSALLGVHRDLLTALAGTANREKTTALSEADARVSVASEIARLQAAQLITAPPQPVQVLDTLVDVHLLTRSSQAAAFAFQHQQFQEWYASFEVERLMLAAAAGDGGALSTLRTEMLNWLAWEESILFACERLSRENETGAGAVASIVIETLGIDPMLAAEMIYRSAAKVWTAVSTRVINFAKSWHRASTADRALRFMITTGRAEFAEQVWALVADTDSQKYLATLRLADPFRPSVLGPDANTRLAALPNAQRAEVLDEIALHGGYEGIELATAIAKVDKHQAVVMEVLRALAFRHANRQFREVVATAGEAVQHQLAIFGGADDLLDKADRTRFAQMRKATFEGEPDSLKRMALLLHADVPGVNTEEELRRMLTPNLLAVTEDQGGSLLREVYERFPSVAVDALVEQLAKSNAPPKDVENICEHAPAADEGPIAEAALSLESKAVRPTLARLMAGPVVIGKLIEQFITLGSRARAQPNNEELRATYYRCRDAISDSRQASFVTALVERADTSDCERIAVLAELLHLHGSRGEDLPLVLSEVERKQLIAVLLRWSEHLLTAPEATRHQIADVMQAVRRVPDAAFVPVLRRMLQRELDDAKKETEEWERSRRSSVTCRYSLQYRFTLAAIGGSEVFALVKEHLSDQEFGIEAAYALLVMWNRQRFPDTKRGFHGWHDYSGVKERRALLGKDGAESNAYAEAIFSVVRELGVSSRPAKDQQRALTLASIGMRMSLGSDRPEIKDLLALSAPYSAKKDLFVVAAQSGIILSADQLNQSVQDLLEEAKKQTWVLDDNRDELMTWVELFAFADRPLAVLELLDRLPPHLKRTYQLRRLIQSLGHSPHADALQVLAGLAERDPAITTDYAWGEALRRLDTIDAARTLLEFGCRPPSSKRGGHDRHKVARELSTFVRLQPALRSDLLERYKNAEPPMREVLEEALLEVSDAETVMVVIREMGKRGEKYDHRLRQVLRELALGKAPSSRWANAFEQFSVELTAFREQLFSMMADPGLRDIAKSCLEEIDQLRDEYGRVNDEPRHPNIAAGRPWPQPDACQ